MLTFKQVFPTSEHFHKYLIDYSIYYGSETYTKEKALVYWTLLYRRYGNSRSAYDPDVFLEQLSLIIAENFREFFLIRELLDVVSSSKIQDLIVGMETVTNVADNPNYTTDPDEILKYIGQQSRTKSKENVVDVVYRVVKRIKVNEITKELDKYQELFINVIPRYEYIYTDEEEPDYEYQADSE